MAALSFYLASTYYRMSTPPNNRYGQYNFAKFVNSSGQTVNLTGLVLYLGSGKGSFHAPESVSGAGGSFTLRVFANSVSSGIYDDVTITNTINATSEGYPPRAQMIKYTVTFNKPVSVSNGGTVQLWWQTQDSSDTKVLCIDPNKCTATTAAANFTVTFDLAGGTRTGGGALVQSIPPGGNATPPTCTRTGYTFAGWDGSYTNITSNRTITAKWTINTYNITFQGNGGRIYVPGVGSVTSRTEKKTYNQAYTIPNWTCTHDSASGEDGNSRPFTGWNTNSSGTGTSYKAGQQYTSNAALTLYAMYGTTTYTVKFVDGYSGKVLKQQNNVPYGGSVTPPPNPTRPGYTFSGWLGNYSYIIADTTIVAMWGIAPVWIMTSSGWVKYTPKED